MAFPVFSKIKSEYLLLLFVLLLSLLIRIWLLDKRWIDPDEGAHMMDAVLILDGKVPSVDFDSRQPVYAHANAGVFRLLGVDYISGRLFPMACSMLAGLTLYFMALLLFDKNVAVLAATIYLMLPLELMNSVIVQTQPMVILLTCLSLFFLILFSKNNRTAWLFAAGFLAAMGFYVRQSALVIPPVVLGFLIIHHAWRFREIILSFASFLMGYFCVILLVLIYYARVMGFEEFLLSGLNPFGFLVAAAEETFSFSGIYNDPLSVQASQPLNSISPNYKLFHRYLLDAFVMHAFLFAGLLFSILTFYRRLIFIREQQRKEAVPGYSLLFLWTFFLSAAYTYYYFTEAFYINYFREFLPPLIIIFAAWLRYSAPVFDNHKELIRFMLFGLLSSIVIYAARSFFPEIFGTGMLISVSLTLFTLFHFAGRIESGRCKSVFITFLGVLLIISLLSQYSFLVPYFTRFLLKLTIWGVLLIVPWVLFFRKPGLAFREYARFISYYIVLGTFITGLACSAGRLTLSYDSNWSPEALMKTAEYVKSHTRPDDSVMSGGVIWELQAQRRPFLNISHPLALGPGISNQDLEKLERAVKEKPPEIIILDGVTEKTYFEQVMWLQSFLDSEYVPVFEATPARQPVRVYRKKSV